MWQIAEATGWSVDYILHRVNYQTLVMMLSDAPRYRSAGERGRNGHQTSGGAELTAEEEAAQVAGLFASSLKR